METDWAEQTTACLSAQDEEGWLHLRPQARKPGPQPAHSEADLGLGADCPLGQSRWSGIQGCIPEALSTEPAGHSGRCCRGLHARRQVPHEDLGALVPLLAPQQPWSPRPVLDRTHKNGSCHLIAELHLPPPGQTPPERKGRPRADIRNARPCPGTGGPGRRCQVASRPTDAAGQARKGDGASATRTSRPSLIQAGSLDADGSSCLDSGRDRIKGPVWR